MLRMVRMIDITFKIEIAMLILCRSWEWKVSRLRLEDLFMISLELAPLDSRYEQPSRQGLRKKYILKDQIYLFKS